MRLSRFKVITMPSVTGNDPPERLVPAPRASLRLVGRTAMDTLRGRADAPSRELAVDTLLAGATFENIDSDEFERPPDAHPLVLLFGYLESMGSER